MFLNITHILLIGMNRTKKIPMNPIGKMIANMPGTWGMAPVNNIKIPLFIMNLRLPAGVAKPKRGMFRVSLNSCT
jgi:hypothetical protein